MIHFYLGTEIRLLRSGGRFYSTHAGLSMRTLEPYLSLGDVTVVGRVEDIGNPDATLSLDDERVSVMELPTYQGLRGLIGVMPRIVRTIHQIDPDQSVVVARLPEPISTLLAMRARFSRIPLLSLVVANCYDLIPGHTSTQKIMRALWGSTVKFLVKESTAVVYVTRSWLQSRFPTRKGTPTLNRSSVLIDRIAAPREQKRSSGAELKVISMGQLTTMIKGIDALIEAVALANRQGLDITLDLLGDGPLRSELEAMTEELGVVDRVHFKGNVTNRDQLFGHLDAADVFVSASRAEGLPRSVIEAMTLGLPVVTTNAGGSAELVDPSMVVPVDDVKGIVQRLHALSTTPELYATLSAENVQMAQTIKESVSARRYREFLTSAFTPIE